MSRWAPPHHFPRAVGGRVYFPLSAVYVNEKKKDGIASRPLIASRRVSAAGFEVNLMGTTLSTNQLQHKCARWLFNFLGEQSAPRPVMCEGAQQHPMQSRLQMHARFSLCARRVTFQTLSPACGSVTRHHTAVRPEH